MSGRIWSSFYPNRTFCDVLKEMRAAHEQKNYSYLSALIEELQYFGNKMEAALADIKTEKDLLDRISELKRQIRILEKNLPKTKKKKLNY